MRQQIEVAVLSYTRELKYSFKSGIITRENSSITLYNPPGFELFHAKHGTIIINHASIGYFWIDNWYNAGAGIDADGKINQWYCNICLPPLEIEEKKITFIDLELDVIKKVGNTAKIVDEDEFEQAIKAYNIPKDIVENVNNTANALLEKMNNNSPPFDKERIEIAI